MFENMVLRIFGPKKDNITREWIKLHNEELNDLYSLGDQIENEVGGACSTYGGEVYAGLCWGNLRETDNLENPCTDGRVI